MSEFSPDWLALREPADSVARSASLTRAIVARLPRDRTVRALDLATGTGSNVRYLAPGLPSPQEWRVVDRDPQLLAHLPRRIASWGLTRGCTIAGDPAGFLLRGINFECRVDARSADLSTLADGTLFQDRDLVTASALLDLVSERWLRVLAERCRDAGAAVLFALTYDGRIACTPEDPDDELVRGLVNRHQRRAKGFGRALGPDASACATRSFEEAGYDCQLDSSDWCLTPTHSELQRQLIAGWAHASEAIAPAQAERVMAWMARRLAWVDDGRSQLVVGHADLAAWPR